MKREYVLAIAIVVLAIIVNFINSNFLSFRTIRTILENFAVFLPTIIGTALVIISGQIDLSVGSVLAVCAITSAQLARAGIPYPLVVFWSLGVGFFLGVINGWLTIKFKLPAMIVTLATMSIWRGFILWWTKGYWITDVPTIWRFFGDTMLMKLPLSVWISIIIAIIMMVLIRKKPFFRYIYAVGSNRSATQFWGISNVKVTFWVLALNGLMAGASAILSASRYFFIPSNIGTGLELTAIASVVVGGVRITGGRGSLEGAILGSLLLTTVSSSLVFLGIDAIWDDAFKGSIILLTVVIDSLLFSKSKEGML
ncbi:inner-membrane translocator [Thermotoga petrophila RKU-10]|jgi:ribose/xylose/arabinose/galactoside ABC-type transport system permease subunit|uniref:Autoinducer 2 import system permease protein LsrC n=1 Tax=Thermotoga petrophila (strain ATCC BAA-489 / DSM 13996 / JCM 10882 / RKU-10) TaxID=590168 RepID=D2C4W4_THEP2|nr:ABC transporter permease [Thermotoga petrophila]ADA67768.1 inner-membrane translocator [Thermotoga petrophila RKU-10]